MKTFIEITFFFFTFFAGVLIGSITTQNAIATEKAVSFYKGYVVIDKSSKKSKNELVLDSCGVKRSVFATKYESSIYNLGDTIK